MNSVSVAICGTYGKAEKFAGLVNGYKGCKVAAVWDRDYEAAKDVADKIGCRAVSDIQDIMGDPGIQGIMIITKNDLHAQIALMACAAGKHIFVEKPVTRTLEEALAVKEAVNKSGVKFFMTDPFVGPAVIFTKKILDAGRLGKPVNCHIQMCDQPFPFKDDAAMKLHTERFGGGMLADRGVHLLHVISYLFGMPETVFARFGYGSEAARECGREEYVTMIMDFAGGLTVSVFCSMNAAGFSDGIDITCTGGCIKDTFTISHNGQLCWRILEKGTTGPGQPSAADPQAGQTAATAEAHHGQTPAEAEVASGWIYADSSDLSVVPDRHVIYWLRMILEDITTEQFEKDPLGNNGLSINRAVELMEIHEAAIRSAAEGIPVSLESVNHS